jgi:hypothetical protein
MDISNCMNIPFPKLMGCLFACFSALLIRQMPAAKAESQVQNATSSNQTNYKPKQKTNPKTNHVNINKSLILVPPPPPTQPSLLDWSGLGDIPDSISYLNADELSAKLAHVQKKINNAKLQVKDSELKFAENKDKVERFNSLFTEGVVSRKELESAKKEVADLEQSADDAKSNLADLEIQEGAIVRQLNLRKRHSKPAPQSRQHKNTKEQKIK